MALPTAAQVKAATDANVAKLAIDNEPIFQKLMERVQAAVAACSYSTTVSVQGISPAHTAALQTRLLNNNFAVTYDSALQQLNISWG